MEQSLGHMQDIQPRPVRPSRQALMGNAVLGMSVFVITELMFFTALVSAFNVIRVDIRGWGPPQNVTLPVLATAFNTFILLTSGVLCFFADRRMQQGQKEKAAALLSQAAILGLCFVSFQGIEWVKLLKYGMTMTSGVFGATFFLLIGSHALHAVMGIMGLGWGYYLASKNRLTADGLRALVIFWAFVVGIWPILYRLVYFK